MSLLLLFCLFSQSKKFLVAETKKSMEVEKVRWAISPDGQD